MQPISCWLAVFKMSVFGSWLVIGTACDAVTTPAADNEFIAELANEARIPRTFAPRLSITEKYRSCSNRVPSDQAIPRSYCGSAPGTAALNLRAKEILSHATAAVHTRADPKAMHAVALVDLIWSDGPGKPLSRSISYLETASRLVDRPAPVLVDLSAAYLVRAEWTQSAHDLQAALEVAERALEVDPRNEAALFNSALALDHIGLRGRAMQAWSRYMAVDSTSNWAREAAGRVRDLSRKQGRPPVPRVGASAAVVAGYATRAPQEARLLGWDKLLGDWAAAVLRGDSRGAEAILQVVGALGHALEQRGSDATIADAVRAIRAQESDPKAIERLARGHRAYAMGRAAYRALDYPSADRWFAEVLAVPVESPTLQGWAAAFRGATLMYALKADSAEQTLRYVVAQVDSARHPALGGQARWALGTTLFRARRYDEALALYHEASRLFAAGGEREHLGAIQYLIGDTESALGDPVAAYASMHRALTTLRPYGSSVWLHNLLYVWARTAAADGFGRVAARMQDEGVEVAARTGEPTYLAEAHLARARLLAAIDQKDHAAMDVAAARSAMERMRSGGVRDFIRSDQKLAEAELVLRRDPIRAAAALDSAVAFFEGGNPLRLLPVLLLRAQVRLALGHVAEAEEDLRRTVVLLDRQSMAMSGATHRATLLDRFHEAFDQLVMLRLAAGRPVEALALLERGRVSYLRARLGSGTGRFRMPPGQVGVAYAMIGDTLLTWTVADTVVHLRRARVDRAKLARSLEGVRASLEIGVEETAIRPELAELFDLLVRPVQLRLGVKDTALVIIADGEIAGVPLAALYDRARKRYLVEDYSLRFAASLADAMIPSSRAPDGTVVLIADPAFAPRAFPGLMRLPGARAEAAAVAAQYPGARFVSGHAANRQALERAFREGRIVHYAGHAVFDDERPERSYLVLAPSADHESGRLTASEIEQLPGMNTSLVVLSACQTSRAQNLRRSGGLAGFAGALLAAGAGGLVGSLWRVDDGFTRSLMPEFHRRYQETGDGAAALQKAQLYMLRNPDPTLRSPSAWAGFRYVGS